MRRASPSAARLRNSLASSTASAPGSEKRGRIGLRDTGRIRAALGDLDGRGERLRQIGEQRHHLGAGLEAVLDGELAPVGLAEHAPLGDAEQRVVGLVVVDGREERLVGGDERHALGVGEVDQRRLDGALLGEAVALQLDIEPVAERRLEGRPGATRRDAAARRARPGRSARPGRR